jgi:hypothetical protein
MHTDGPPTIAPAARRLIGVALVALIVVLSANVALARHAPGHDRGKPSVEPSPTPEPTQTPTPDPTPEPSEEPIPQVPPDAPIDPGPPPDLIGMLEDLREQIEDAISDPGWLPDPNVFQCFGWPYVSIQHWAYYVQCIQGKLLP